MTGASKILTVSYGTFSCTLEGFDDPFNTMKAIAEYFRDLAAEDRYFGAEPPTPDAAMLHRIAEREIQRRVEAKIQDNGVILRAGETAPALPAEAPARPALLEAEATGAESVAERLQRIRARHNAPQAATSGQVAAGREAPSAAPVDEAPEPEAPVAAIPASPVPASVAPVSAAPVAAAPVSAVPPPAAETYIEDEHAEPVTLAPAGLTESTTAAADSVEIPDQIEQLLEDAAERGAASLTAEEIEDSLPETEISDETQAETPDQIEAVDEDALLARLSEATETHDAPEVDAPEVDVAKLDGAKLDGAAEDLAGDFDESALLAKLSGALDGAEAAPQAQADEAAAEWDSAWDEDDLNLSDLDDRSDLTVAADQSLPDAPDALIEDAAQIAAPEAVEPEAPAAEVAAPEAVDPEVAAPAPRARARVIRIRRADPAAAPAPAAEVSPMGMEDAAVAAAPTALSLEAEEALQAELAALEAELSGALVQPDPVSAQHDAIDRMVALAEPTPVVAGQAPRRHIDPPAEDEAVSRLMAQADSHMSGEDTRRRQSAIAHLKAAVAATVADREATGRVASGRDKQIDVYRNDLDRVVRPRRPVSEGAASRPTPAASGDSPVRPTPLVLVSAQRIDRSPAETPVQDSPRVVMPVRPRRPVAPVARAEAAMGQSSAVMPNSDQSDLEDDDMLDPSEAGNVFADATSFQDFVDQLGAQNLPDLLEAAAVYCAEVLQRPEFSRPLVMRQIAALPNQAETPREDYLRGFGTLLRQGRIAKVKRGMFALTDRSPYLAEARKLAG